MLSDIDTRKQEATLKLDSKKRSELGQFLTESTIAAFMSEMFSDPPTIVRLLDAGAGIGTLGATYINNLLSNNSLPSKIFHTTFEIDPILITELKQTHAYCKKLCEQKGVEYEHYIIETDFVTYCCEYLDNNIFSDHEFDKLSFNRIIINPPYVKINSKSDHRKCLRKVGIESTNLYSAFLSICIRLLEESGEIVAITPRSFCNGPYFTPLRKDISSLMTIDKIHIFDSRKDAFKNDNVLQENIIYKMTRHNKTGNEKTVVTSSPRSNFENCNSYTVPFNDILQNSDPEAFIHIITSDTEKLLAERAMQLECNLADLGLKLSTGPVVDFRLRKHLREEAGANDCELIYPSHFNNGTIDHNKQIKKKCVAIEINDETRKWLVNNGTYVVTKRFTSKEEKRRIVAAINYKSGKENTLIGLENHLNYFHNNHCELPENIAKGLCIFLNCTFIDQYFRIFNGHTQVNATDLRSLRYPSKKQLELLSEIFENKLPEQQIIDEHVESVIFNHLKPLHKAV